MKRQCIVNFMVGTRVAAHLHHDDVDETTVLLSIMESVKVKFGFETETWISHVKTELLPGICYCDKKTLEAYNSMATAVSFLVLFPHGLICQKDEETWSLEKAWPVFIL
ncbi:hypothetical protein D5086_015965 [Populus alba]|uniref:Uncharacterized protein n=1 Tax=Populus alba TaxID=43335 RepID=A0ACC4BSN3_POPAL